MTGTTVVPSFKGTPVQEWARALVDQARRQAQTQSPTRDFAEAFKHALASGVARALAENDKFVQTIYAYEPTAADRATIHLLVLVTRPSAALEAFIATVNRALVTQLQNMGQPAPRESVLDVNVFTQEEVRRGVGYGALLHSVSPPPQTLWQRE